MTSAAPELDDEVLFADVEYATGESGREQVLGWDDIQSEETWGFLSSTGVTRLSLPKVDAGRLAGRRAFQRVLVSETSDAQRGVADIDDMSELLKQLVVEDVIDAELGMVTAVSCALGRPAAHRMTFHVASWGVQRVLDGVAQLNEFPFSLADLLAEATHDLQGQSGRPKG